MRWGKQYGEAPCLARYLLHSVVRGIRGGETLANRFVDGRFEGAYERTKEQFPDSLGDARSDHDTD